MRVCVRVGAGSANDQHKGEERLCCECQHCKHKKSKTRRCELELETSLLNFKTKDASKGPGGVRARGAEKENSIYAYERTFSSFALMPPKDCMRSSLISFAAIADDDMNIFLWVCQT